MQICDVLEYLHGHQPQPIVFRDLKPSNIIVTAEGKLTLIDFGIAKVFQSDKRGTMIGTEGYAPPEQYRGLAEPRGDIYALGATMHHLLTNSDPRSQTPVHLPRAPDTQVQPSRLRVHRVGHPRARRVRHRAPLAHRPGSASGAHAEQHIRLQAKAPPVGPPR